jgi:hypothetical protein
VLPSSGSISPTPPHGSSSVKVIKALFDFIVNVRIAVNGPSDHDGEERFGCYRARAGDAAAFEHHGAALREAA